MTDVHVVRVFVGPGGAGGNELAVYLEGNKVPPEKRLAVTAELGFSCRLARANLGCTRGPGKTNPAGECARAPSRRGPAFPRTRPAALRPSW